MTTPGRHPNPATRKEPTLTDTRPLADLLDTVADLMDADNARCTAAYGHPVGIPMSMLDDLARRAAYGPWIGREFDREWGRIGRAEGVEAAKAWSGGLEARHREVVQVLCPQGLHGRPPTSDEVRVLAAGLRAA